MKPKAYSYIRFSRPEQIKGHSLIRQTEMSYKYCKENNLTLDTDLYLYDKGISAFEGKNVEQGALGAFLKAVELGDVPKGSYLLVESLDRLSRQDVLSALRLFLNILEKGIIIVTLSDKIKYDNESINPYELIISITIMIRAHDESKEKSKRVLAANRNKRKNINNKKLTSICPAWLKLNEDKKTFNIIKEKAKTIQHIFKLSKSGLGTFRIISELNKHKIQTISKSNNWQPSSISKILKGREVLGELTSKSKDGEQIYKKYYPAIISEELFYLVQEGIKSRNISGGGRKGKTTTNLFQKILICGYSLDNNTSGYRCDSTNVTVIANNKASKNKKGYTYLQCATKKRSNNGCTECRKSWRLDHFETSFLAFVNEIDITSLTNTPNKIKEEIENLNSLLTSDIGKLNHIRSKIKNISNSIETESDKHIPIFLLKLGKKLEEEEKSIVENIKTNETNLKLQEHEYNNSENSKEKLVKLVDIMPTLNGKDLQETRLKLSSILRNTIERIEIYSCGNILTDQETDKVKTNLLKKMGKKTAEYYKKNMGKINGTKLPYFIVRYKTGSYQHVVTDPKDPKTLYVSIKPDSVESSLF